ncbi:MAG TPA: hypothetical protein ENJ07_02845 [Gammaproteobacteria bacterium]|nr:hypothetical protein [Gammaproteobacteria bacterium]
MKEIWAILLSALFVTSSALAENSISLLINPQLNNYSSDTLFAVPDSIIEKPKATSQQIIELTGANPDQLVDLSYLFSLHNQLSSSRSPDTIFKTNELYLSKSLNNWEIMLGRKISSWGVGYGFRPLDVVQQYDQQTISRQSDMGKNMVALEYFSGMSSWSLLWVNPAHSKNSENKNYEVESIVSKYSTSQESYDLHAVFRYNEKNRFQLGFGGINILSDEVAVHGSLLFSQLYQKQLHQLGGQSSILLAEYPPYKEVDYSFGFQVLAGLSWSGLSKNSLIVEHWYNELAYSDKQWDQLFKLAEQQQNLLNNRSLPQSIIHGNIAWTAAATQTQALAQHNLMLQWSYDADYWKPTANILLSPVDKSSMITLSTTRSTHLFKFEAGIRTFNGANDSIYGGLIVSNTVFMTLSGEY